MGKDARARHTFFTYFLTDDTVRPFFSSIVLLALVLYVPVYGHSGAPSGAAASGRFYIENKGQWDEEALFLARSPGLDVWLTRSGVVYDAYEYTGGTGANEKRRRGSVVRMEFLHSHEVTMEGVGRQAGTYRYFRDETTITGAGLYQSAKAGNLYEGIDAVYYFDNGVPRYDLVVQPGTDYKQIALVFRGARAVSLTPGGSLAIMTDNGVLEQRGLITYQIKGNRKDTIASRFVLHTSASGESVVSFALDHYDPSRPLVIDPIVYSSFLGGTGDDIVEEISLDHGGNTYVLGTTQSVDFPVTTGAYDTTTGSTDIFVTKYDYSGSNVLFSTFIGGSGDETARGLARDNFGYLYITGETSSTDFPAQYTYPELLPQPGGTSVFVVCLSGTGNTLRYATLLGGSRDDRPEGIAVDRHENVYVTGTTASHDFPQYRATSVYRGGEDAFLFSLDKNGQWRFSALLGGTDNDHGKAITVDALDAVWIGGETRSVDLPQTDGSTHRGGDYNVFFAKWDLDGARNLVGYIGLATGFTTAITSDKDGNAYIAGYTPEAAFNLPASPIQPQYSKQYSGGKDGFIVSLTPQGKPRYSTLLGAAYDDIPRAVIVDAHDNLIIVGSTTQSGVVEDFLPDSYYPRYSRQEGFVAVLKPGNQTFSYSTYLGGSRDDECVAVTVSPDSVLYIAGNTLSPDFPITVGTREYKAGLDGFITRLQYIPKVALPAGPLVIDFGEVYIGESRRGSVTIRNQGKSTAELTSFTIRNGTVFSVLTSVPATLPIGDFSFECMFTPAVAGTVSDEVHLTVRFLPEPLTVILKGKGIKMPPPVVAVQPDTLHFGDVNVASTETGIIVVTNAGAVPATISSITLSNTVDFSLTGISYPLTLLPSQSRSLAVDFTPATTGETFCSVHIEVERMTTALVSFLTGNGVSVPAPVLSVPEAFDFGKVQIGSRKEWTQAVYNSGTTAATLSVEQPPADVFSVTIGTLVVEPNSSVNMVVSFLPVKVGNVTTRIQVPVQELSKPLTIDVEGEGVFPAVTVATIDFGEVTIHTVRTGTTAVRNIGIDTARIASIASGAGAFTVLTTGPAKLDVQEELPVRINFTPDRTGEFAETVWITVDYLPDPVPVMLRGKGIADDAPQPRIISDRDTLDMGTMAIRTSTTASFVLYNLSTTQSVQVTTLALSADANPTFELVGAPSVPFTIDAGGVYPVTVRFRPDVTGPASAVVSIGSSSSSLTVVVLGNGMDDTPPPVFDTARVEMSGRQVVVGEEFDLTAVWEQPLATAAMLEKRGITDVRVTLEWNASVLSSRSAGGTVQSGIYQVVLEAPLSASGTLFRLPVRTLLGNAEFTDVSITKWEWLPALADTARLHVVYDDSCRIAVTDVWHDGDGPRLVNPFAGVLTLEVAPNPFTDKVTMTAAPAGAGRTLAVYDMLGTLVLDLTARLNDSNSVELTASELPSPGIYFCRLAAGGSVLVRTLILR